jgi:hypothetical protein
MTKLQQRLIQQISSTEDEEILHEIERILGLVNTDQPYILSEEQVSLLEKSLEQSNRGEVISSEEADREAWELIRS